MILPPILPALDQYCIEVKNLPFDRSREQEIVKQARAGDEVAREQLIQQCLRYVIKLAYSYEVYLDHDGVEDIISIGNLALVECLEKALAQRNPVAYLFGCVRIRILTHVTRFSSLITRPHYREPIPVGSIDFTPAGSVQVACERGITQEEKEQLYRAMDNLTPLQQEVISAQFNLSGHQDDHLKKLSKRNAQYRVTLHQALQQMREYLEEEQRGLAA